MAPCPQRPTKKPILIGMFLIEITLLKSVHFCRREKGGAQLPSSLCLLDVACLSQQEGKIKGSCCEESGESPAQSQAVKPEQDCRGCRIS